MHQQPAILGRPIKLLAESERDGAGATGMAWLRRGEAGAAGGAAGARAAGRGERGERGRCASSQPSGADRSGWWQRASAMAEVRRGWRGWRSRGGHCWPKARGEPTGGGHPAQVTGHGAGLAVRAQQGRCGRSMGASGAGSARTGVAGTAGTVGRQGRAESPERQEQARLSWRERARPAGWWVHLTSETEQERTR